MTTAMTTDRLLAIAYDLEQAGQLADAANMRRVAHDPALFATVTAAYLEDRARVARLVDQALDPLLAGARMLDQATRDPRADSDSPSAPFGTLADGTPIAGSLDRIEPGGRGGCTMADVGDWALVASRDGGISINDNGDDATSINIDVPSIAQIDSLRRLLASGVPEQLIASAVAWYRGDDAPPSLARPAPTVDNIGYLMGKIAGRLFDLDPSHTDRALTVLAQLDDSLPVPPVAEHPAILAARAYDQAPSPATYQAAAQAWEAAGLSVKEDDDDDARVVFTDTSRPITVERVESGHDRAWLDFTTGALDDHRVVVGVDIVGGRPGIDLIILGNQVGSGFVEDPALTLADLRQIRDDLSALLEDDRLVGALAEQQV
jgi:hypothetical protein